MPSTIFSGTKVKALKKILDLNGGIQIHSSTVDPTSSATDATIGTLLINETTGNIYKKLDSGSSTNWELLEFGAGGINYADGSSSGFEATVGSWLAYADAAASSPVDGTGGSPTVTITRTTSSPLRGIASGLITKDAANRQGEGASLAFSIDSADKAKVVRVSADYEVASGTFSYGDGTVATPSDIRVFIYDVTNAVIIEPSQTLLNGSGKIVTEFQASSNSTSYRLILHVATVSASAWTFKFDNVQVGPREIARGPIVTDWVAYTPSTNGFGTISALTALWRRVGDSLEIKATFTSGTTTAAAARINLPTGLTISSSLSTNGAIVGGWVSQKSTTNANRNSASAFVKASNGNFISASNVGDGASAANLTEILANAVFTSTTVQSVHVTGIPIQGWASNVVTSSDSGTRLVATTLKLSGNQSVASASETTISFDTVVFDKTGIFSLANNGVIIGESGVCDVTIQTYVTSLTALDNTALNIKVNGTIVRQLFYPLASTIGSFAMTADIDVKAGDIVTTSIDSAADTAFTLDGDGARTFLSVAKRQSPQTIGMADKVVVRASGNPASATSGNIIIFPTVDYDTTGSYSSSTGRFTSPINGFCRVHGAIGSANAAVDVNIFVNASSVILAGSTNSAGEGTYSGTVKVNAGDLVDLRPNGSTLDVASGSTIHFEMI